MTDAPSGTLAAAGAIPFNTPMPSHRPRRDAETCVLLRSRDEALGWPMADDVADGRCCRQRRCR
eukprot:4744517-Prymnesium_polylepis.1